MRLLPFCVPGAIFSHQRCKKTRRFMHGLMFIVICIRVGQQETVGNVSLCSHKVFCIDPKPSVLRGLVGRILFTGVQPTDNCRSAGK